MEDISQNLIDFSDEHNLWDRTIKSGRNCLLGYFKEEKSEAEQLFPGLSPDDFILEQECQSLFFWQFNLKRSRKTFVLRTKCTLLIFKEGRRNIVGFYALEVNQNGEIVDDFLHFD